ncbi:Glycosyltransferase involved in cell wall bisynthesis [Ralstonia sp. 25mfcol4.1]|uniref:glycosyltransferase family 4 protein n=1 Tax=Ralstonia sp. 25mfcol4.1 TaxID=1761899 RepID=UPI0004164BAB|nr:glycosyltransferase family 4 protein [Ralstonia sp. 25mfcol4.1]SDP57036.1 Glycosyltransferase involved in cell wall bisynthesis [Ralstonia sp. 25mfcol4.1]
MSKLPTICFLTGTLNAFAGAERMTAVIASALAERRYRVFVLSLWDRDSVFPLHPDVVHDALFESRPSFKRKYLATVAGIRRFVRQHGVDVLIEVDTMLTLFTLPATVGLKVRRIAWEHCHFDEDLGRRARRMARWLAAGTNEAVVVLTERDRRRWLQTVRPRSTVTCIANPLPFPFPDMPSPRRNKTVLAMGRLVYAKGFDVLIRAWARIAPVVPDWSLVIHGDGEERQSLEALVDNLGLRNFVRMPGVCADASAAYTKASIFCLSSRYEGFGLVLIEAMAFGLPIVSTNCETGPRELLRSGDNALTVPVEDPEALGAALLEAIRGTSDMASLTAAGRRLASTFDAKLVVTAWEVLLDAKARPSACRHGSA